MQARMFWVAAPVRPPGMGWGGVLLTSLVLAKILDATSGERVFVPIVSVDLWAVLVVGGFRTTHAVRTVRNCT